MQQAKQPDMSGGEPHVGLGKQETRGIVLDKLRVVYAEWGLDAAHSRT
jgi:hypothetical protein